MLELRRFQTQFLRAVESDRYDLAALSMGRGNGKSALAAHILTRCLTPGDRLHVRGAEYLLGAASLAQARLCFRFVREWLEPTGEYRFMDSAQRIGITHPSTKTTLRVFSSDAKASFGIVGTPLLVLDEPGALETVGGELLADSIMTAMGKPDSRLRVVMIGTLSPMATRAGHWWYDLIEAGTVDRNYVQLLQGDRETWDSWPTIRKANPLTAISPEFRTKLLSEKRAAVSDPRLKARFLSYRLNLPSQDSSTMLLLAEDWQRVLAREVPEREGQPIVAVDMGAERAWSAAVALWPSGRAEAVACCPGLPDVAAQEKRDRAPAGEYQRLVDAGLLLPSEGLYVPTAAQLIAACHSRWGAFKVIVCDRARLGELRGAAKGKRVQERVSQWFQASEDVRALRKLARDGGLSVEVQSRALLTASLAVAQVENDTSGNTRLKKKGSSNESRDDVAAALVLAAGHLERTPPRRRGLSLGLA